MSTESDHSHTVRIALTAEAVIGAGFLLFLPQSYIQSALGMALVEWAILLGILVITPLAVEVGLRNSGPMWPKCHAWLIAIFQPIGATLALVSITQPIGDSAGLLAGGWFIQTLLVGFLGLRRILMRGLSPINEFVIDVGHLYLIVGGVWFTASRWDPTFMGFGPVLIALTAAHFHFAGLGASVIAGQLGMLLRSGRVYVFGVTIIGLTPILVALGIYGSPILEVATSIILALGVISIAALCVKEFLPKLWGPNESYAKRLCFFVLIGAQAVSFVTMTLACIYALGEYLGSDYLPIASMVKNHGFWNAFFFILPSFIALRSLAPIGLKRYENIPFQRFVGKRKIGQNYFDKHIDQTSSSLPRGVFPSVEELITPPLENKKLHPDVKSFFNDTSELILICLPHWKFGFRTLGKVYCFFAKRTQQLVLPVEKREHSILSKLVFLTDRPGISTPIGSTRLYSDDSPMYVASYAQHTHDGIQYMNISLPLPGGELQTNLRGFSLPGDENYYGLKLSSTPASPKGDEGIWVRILGLIVKLPLTETLNAWPASFPNKLTGLPFRAKGDATMVATHTFKVFGLTCLVLDYAIIPKCKWDDSTPTLEYPSS